MSTPTTINEEYDIIIAGGAQSPSFLPLLSSSDRKVHPTGGTAGCIIASRLATADADLRILVLEAGPTTHNDLAHRHPALLLSHIAPGSRTVRMHVSRPSAALGGRLTAVHVGQCLGGGGSVNCAFISLLPPPTRPCTITFGARNKEEDDEWLTSRRGSANTPYPVLD